MKNGWFIPIVALLIIIQIAVQVGSSGTSAGCSEKLASNGREYVGVLTDDGMNAKVILFRRKRNR